jgi:O-antigen biosynthesis protein
MTCPDLKSTKIAVVLHLFHIDLWSLFKKRLEQLPQSSDLFVTTPDYLLTEVERLVLPDFPSAQIYGFQNRGRDVGPLINLLQYVQLHKYDLVLKVHTKKSTHKKGSQGDEWRNNLLNGLLPQGRIPLIIDFFSKNPNIGIAGPDQYLAPLNKSFYHPETISHWNNLTENRTQYPNDAKFFAGTMFWARGAIYLELQKLNLRQSDFEQENGQLDGTLAHALERYFPILAYDQNLIVAGFNFNDASIWATKRTLSNIKIKKFTDYLDGKINLHVIVKMDVNTLYEKAITTISSLDLASHGLINTSTEILTNPLKSSFFTSNYSSSSEKSFDWLLFVNAGDEFTPSGLLTCMSQIIQKAELLAAYTDKLILSPSGNIEAALLPDFDEELLLSFPWLMSNHWLFSRKAIKEVGILNHIEDKFFELEFILKLTRDKNSSFIHHIPEPLLITSEPNNTNSEIRELEIINKHIKLTHSKKSHISEIKPRVYKSTYHSSITPLVSIIIQYDSLEKIQKCIESLLCFTSYKKYEVIIIYKDFSDVIASLWLKGLNDIDSDRFRIIDSILSKNNIININYAASFAKGSYLLFLEDHIQFFDPTWLDSLLNHGLRNEVGAVGPKVIDLNLLINQSGIILGLHGLGESAFIREFWSTSGYMQRLSIDQNFNALSSKCLLISKELFLETKGFDELINSDKLSCIDLCLRIRQKGLKVIWTPHSIVATNKLTNASGLENSSSFFDKAASIEQSIFFSKWIATISNDSAYNPNFSLVDKAFAIEPDVNITFRPLSWRPDPVILIHPSDNSGCGNYRLIQPLRTLEESGLVDGLCSFRPLLPAELERIKPDTIIFQKPFDDFMLEYMKHSKVHSNAYKIFEIDDLIHRLSIKNPDRKKFPTDLIQKIRSGISLADKLIVSTPGLAEAFNGWHQYIQVLELKLPPDWWLNLEIIKTDHKKPRVGWAGGSSHLGDLELIFDVVKNLANEVDWVFFGMCPEQLRPYIKELHYGVDIDSYPQKLASLNLDLALAPLENNHFNDCKSNLRLLEYGACGYPVVCSNTRSYVESNLSVCIVKNRYKDWVEAIRNHANDLKSSLLLGEQLKKEVQLNWMLRDSSLKSWKESWLM